MIQTIAKVELPVDEVLKIRKMRWKPDNERAGMKRISIVTGIHGDELEGQYVCFMVGERIRAHPEYLDGIVDIFPAMNPFGINAMTRGIPAFDLDMNRIFPGQKGGDMNEYLASLIIRDVSGSDMVLDIHSSNAYLTEVPQVRINTLHKKILVPWAQQLGLDLIWVHPAASVLESTFAYSLNSTHTPALVVEMGIGMRITKEYCSQLTEGIFHLCSVMGIWKEKLKNVKRSVLSLDPDDIIYLNAPKSGVYIKEPDAGSDVNKGDLVGRLVSPLNGTVLSEIKAPDTGWLFTQRDYPIAAEGSLLGRILRKRGRAHG